MKERLKIEDLRYVFTVLQKPQWMQTHGCDVIQLNHNDSIPNTHAYKQVGKLLKFAGWSLDKINIMSYCEVWLG